MKIFLKIVKITFLILLVLIVIFVSAIIYFDQFHKKEICRESSPDGTHTFVFYQIGAPGWPFGPVKAEIRVLNANGRTVDKETFVVNNDGKQLCVWNILTVRWNESKLEIELIGDDDSKPTTYVFDW